MSRVNRKQAHPKIKFTKPFSLKKKKSLKYISIISKLQLKLYIIQGNSSREWLILKTNNKKTKQNKNTPHPKTHTQQKP